LADIGFKDIAIIIGGIITAVSTLSAVLITSRFNLKLARLNLETQSQQKDYERRLLKVEEIYLLFEKWETSFSTIYLTHLRCYLGKLDYPSVMELTKTSAILLPGEAQKLKMLMNVHFPKLAHDYRLINEARHRIAPFLCDPNESKLKAEDFISAQEDFEKVCVDFKSKISHLAQEH
jgi:hypothetical protein